MQRMEIDSGRPHLVGVSAVYSLFATITGPVRRVGQTSDMEQRRAQHVRDGTYRYFTYREVGLGDLDYEECRDWHEFGGEDGELDGNHPPEPPSGCPFCA